MKNASKTHWTCALAASALIGGMIMVGPASAEDAENSESDPQSCMLSRNVEHYRVIDGNWIVITDRREEVFLLGHLQPRCWDLQSSFHIALATPQISVCAGDMLDLAVDEGRCRIVQLEAVSSYEDAETIVSVRQNVDD